MMNTSGSSFWITREQGGVLSEMRLERYGGPDRVSLTDHNTNFGLYSKNNWKSLKGHKQRNDMIISVL